MIHYKFFDIEKYIKIIVVLDFFLNVHVTNNIRMTKEMTRDLET